ncbi:MAG: MMPL family transporter, partial [Microlunatus sp.]|nr:MMPL family transporter [Microlunatus sp.]
MNRVTGWVLRHKLLVVLCWLVVTVAGFATLSSTTSRLSTNFALPGQPGYVTDARITALYHNGGGAQPTVVVATAPTGRQVDAARAHAIFNAAVAAVPGSRVADAASTGDPKFVTLDGRTAFGLVFTRQPKGFGADPAAARITAAVQRATPPGWQTGVTGQGQLSQGGSSKGTSTLTETMIGALGALVVLAFVFGSLLAFLPLLMAAVAILSTFLLIGGLTRITSVSLLVEFLVALIGLGVAIDYSLLVVTRWREERDRGAGREEAVLRAMERAGHAVVFSGLTVGISLLAVLVVPVPFLRNMAVAGFFIPLVSIAVAITLLPVLLVTVGNRIDRPRWRHEVHASRPWTAWARLVLRHRAAATAVGALILLTLLVPLSTLRLGEPPSTALSGSGPAYNTLNRLTENAVPRGVLAPIEVLTTPGSAASVSARLARVDGVYAAVSPPAFRAGDTRIVDVLPVAEPSTPSGNATIDRVQAAAHAMPGVLGIGGAGPTQNDFIHAVYGS